MLLLIPADSVVHQRKDVSAGGRSDLLSGYAIPNCVPQDDETKAGEPLGRAPTRDYVQYMEICLPCSNTFPSNAES